MQKLLLWNLCLSVCPVFNWTNSYNTVELIFSSYSLRGMKEHIVGISYCLSVLLLRLYYSLPKRLFLSFPVLCLISCDWQRWVPKLWRYNRSCEGTTSTVCVAIIHFWKLLTEKPATHCDMCLAQISVQPSSRVVYIELAETDLRWP